MTSSSGLAGRSSEPKRVLVTGATGQQGGRLARLLLRRGHQVRALTRKPTGAAAEELRRLGAEVAAGDLGDRASIERSAKGIEAAFLVATPYEQGVAAEAHLGKTALDGLRTAGVPYVVYSSVSDADRKTGIPHFDSKAEIERHLQALGTPYSIVAPVFFSENLLSPWIAGGLAKGVLATGVVPDRKLQVISLPELAEFTALAVENPKTFHGKRVNVASDELSPNEIARQLAEALGRPVSYQPIPLEAVRQQSADMAKMYDWFNRVGYSAEIQKLKAGYPQVDWRSFRDWAGAQDWARVLNGPTGA